jgi:hypothetical protein
MPSGPIAPKACHLIAKDQSQKLIDYSSETNRLAESHMNTLLNAARDCLIDLIPKQAACSART